MQQLLGWLKWALRRGLELTTGRNEIENCFRNIQIAAHPVNKKMKTVFN